MPSKKQYNLVNDDAYDSRIPLYNDDAFQHGIMFHAKYVGTLDIPRPANRLEIVAAMRRTRYEHKAKSSKKKKVIITVSIEGVKVAIRHKKKGTQWPWDENKFIVMQHPIYRIFYVSHDSQDMKIFSYIARDGGTNVFKCNVFKSKKNNQAMRIVRTIGQAFEVCHKMSLAFSSSSIGSPLQEDVAFSQLPDNIHKGDGASEPNSCDTQAEELPSSKTHTVNGITATSNENMGSTRKSQNEFQKQSVLGNGNTSDTSSLCQQVQLLKDQLNDQNQRMQVLFNQVQLLKDQLAAETASRLQTQAENQHLLAYNRELLEHILKQVQHLREVEQRYHCDNRSDTRMLPELSPFPKALSESSSGSQPLQLEGVKKKNVSIVERSRPEGLSASSPLEQGPDAMVISGGPSHFTRQQSASSFPIACSSPRFSFRDTGVSLPNSPFQRQSPADSDFLQKSNSPSLRHSKRLTNQEPHHSPSSPSKLKTDQDSSKFDFLPNMALSLMQSENNYTDCDVPHSIHENSQQSKFSRNKSNQSNGDSFIKQVTRDLGKLEVVKAEPEMLRSSPNYGLSSRFRS